MNCQQRWGNPVSVNIEHVRSSFSSVAFARKTREAQLEAKGRIKPAAVSPRTLLRFTELMGALMLAGNTAQAALTTALDLSLAAGDICSTGPPGRSAILFSVSAAPASFSPTGRNGTSSPEDSFLTRRKRRQESQPAKGLTVTVSEVFPQTPAAVFLPSSSPSLFFFPDPCRRAAGLLRSQLTALP